METPGDRSTPADRFTQTIKAVPETRAKSHRHLQFMICKKVLKAVFASRMKFSFHVKVPVVIWE